MEKQSGGTKLYGFKFEQQKTQNYPANKVNKMHYTLDIGKPELNHLLAKRGRKKTLTNISMRLFCRDPDVNYVKLSSIKKDRPYEIPNFYGDKIKIEFQLK